jgi:hypothetical protein
MMRQSYFSQRITREGQYKSVVLKMTWKRWNCSAAIHALKEENHCIIILLVDPTSSISPFPLILLLNWPTINIVMDWKWRAGF